MTAEGRIQHEILLALTADAGHACCVWRANCGAAWLPGAGGKMRPVRFGVPGQADISGIMADGRRLEIEVKTQRGRLSPEQRVFSDVIRQHGGIYILARSATDAVSAVLTAYDEGKQA